MITTSDLSIEELTIENVSLKNEVLYLKEQLEWFKRQIFGKSSEKVVSTLHNEQLTLEGFEPQENSPEQKLISSYTRNTSESKGKDKIVIPSDLPVETILIDIPEEQKKCSETGVSLVKIGEEVSHKLAHRPGSYYIKEIIRPKYAYPGQEEKGIVTGELPDSIIPKCRADESFLAELLTKKFADHLPLYRISEILGREGLGISRKLLSQWVIRSGEALTPLYEKMLTKVLESKNIHIDETPVKVQESPQCKTAYMWVVAGGEVPYRVYKFCESRAHEHAMELLKEYVGIFHSDKYGAYEKLARKENLIWCPCFAHIRRKFFESGSNEKLRDWVVRKIRYLFMLEKVAWCRSPEERQRIRNEKEIPIIDELIEKIKKTLVEGKILPKSKLREALGYFCSLIPYLKNYTKHPFARIDNNIAERAVRPLAIGRKNWLFFGSEEGGKAGAVILSLVQTCRGLGINPREYVEDVMRKLMGYNSQKLDELVPDQWVLRHKSSA
jgi:transposase